MGKDVKTGILAFCLTSLVCLSAGTPRQQALSTSRAPAGRIIDITPGDWKRKADPANLLRRGEMVYAGDTLVRPRGHSIDDLYLSVVLLNGRTIGCGSSAKNPCSQDVLIAPTLDMPAPGFNERVSRVVSAVIDAFSGPPPPVIYAMARGSSEPNEAVLRFADGKLDLSYAMQNVSPGHYLVELTRLGTTGALAPPLRVDFAWKPPSSPPAHLTLTPAVYRLQLLSPDEDVVGSSVAVLIETPARYRQADIEFQEAKKITEAWRNDMRPDSLHYIWTAYLFRLAEESAVHQGVGHD